ILSRPATPPLFPYTPLFRSAFTENIQYFATSIAEAGGLDGTVGETFFVRGILAPFSHVMFTCCTGLLIGLAARKGSILLSIGARSEEHTSELQSRENLVCRL